MDEKLTCKALCLQMKNVDYICLSKAAFHVWFSRLVLILMLRLESCTYLFGSQWAISFLLSDATQLYVCRDSLNHELFYRTQYQMRLSFFNIYMPMAYKNTNDLGCHPWFRFWVGKAWCFWQYFNEGLFKSLVLQVYLMNRRHRHLALPL